MIHPSLMGLFLFVVSVAPIETAQIDDRFNFFDIDLVEAVLSEGEDNVVVSPASVKAALTTLIEGTGGRTAEELLSLFRLPSDQAGIRAAARRSLAPFKTPRVGVQLDLATRLWTGYNVQVTQRYGDALRQNYDSDIQSVNFGDPSGSAAEINGWVYQHTQGHIQSIITPGSLGTDTKLLLTNALYLKGNWKKSFDKALTVNKCFQVPNFGCQNAYLMHSLDYYPFANVPSLAANVVEIPYADGLLSMLIILPERKEDGINRLARDLAHIPLVSIIRMLRETEVLLTIPQFSIETKSDLRPIIEKLGVRDMFDPVNANLSNMISGPVQVGSVQHNAKIQVNEEGTIAAAVTAAAVIPLMGSTVQRFTADRPFIFILRDSESGGILFAGRVTRPDLAPNKEDKNTNTQSFRRRSP